MTAPAHQEVSADSELRAALKDDSTSSLAKYMLLTTGERSLWKLLRFELLTFFLKNLPGAPGILLRQKLYPLLIGEMGRGVVIGAGVTIRHPHRIRLGDRVIVDDHGVLDAKGRSGAKRDDEPWTIDIGADGVIGRNTVLSCKSMGENAGRITLAERVNISVNCTLLSETDFTIGTKVLIAGHCYLIAGGNHGTDRTDVPILDQPMIEKGGIDIGDHCWLGANVTVLDGVVIGRDSVIAAGAVVTRSVPEYTVAGGVPAKVLKERRAAETIA